MEKNCVIKCGVVSQNKKNKKKTFKFFEIFRCNMTYNSLGSLWLVYVYLYVLVFFPSNIPLCIYKGNLNLFWGVNVFGRVMWHQRPLVNYHPLMKAERFCRKFGNFFHHNFDSAYRMSHQKRNESCYIVLYKMVIYVIPVLPTFTLELLVWELSSELKNLYIFATSS